MIYHLAATEAYYQIYTFEKRDFNEEEKAKWMTALTLGDKAREELKGKPITYYLDIYNEVRLKTKELLKTKDDKWFSKKNGAMTNHWAWFHVMEHQSNHMGQLAFLTKRLPKSLKNKVALITGGTKGIGYGIAQALLNEGINVAVTSRSESSAQKAADALNSNSLTGAKAIGIKADVRDYESQKQAVNSVLEYFNKLDIVIANAGLGHFASVEDLTLKSSVEALKESKGYFITISSLAGTNFFANGSAYNASKFGVTGFTQAVMLDLRKYDIKVSTIMPGSVATYFNNHTPNENDAWKIQIDDIGELVVGLIKMNPRTLPSKIEVRPTMPPSK
jgi:3-oxoacyl-[acyl-carrier protein] reductase